MKKEIEFTPANIGLKPNPDKYYGVTFPDFSENGSEYTSPTRAFIASWCGYPNPTSFITICASKMTAGNTWDKIKDFNDNHEKTTLENYIIRLYQIGWKVYEFDTARELFEWLSDCEDKKKVKRF